MKTEVSPNTYLKTTAARADKSSSFLKVPNSHSVHLTCLFLFLTCLFLLSASACMEEFDIWSFISCLFNKRCSMWALDLRWQAVSQCNRAVYIQQGYFRGSEGREIFFENVKFWRFWKKLQKASLQFIILLIVESRAMRYFENIKFYYLFCSPTARNTSTCITLN